jgi:DNA-3-methyladenine glycosylase II
MAEHTVILRPTAPYDFDLSARIFANGDDSFRSYKEGVFSCVLRGSRGLTLCMVSSTGSVDRPELSLRTYRNGGAEPEAGDIIKKVGSILNLELDLKPFYRMAANDPLLAKLTKELRGLKSPTTETIFEALIDSIIEQQISLNVARTFEMRLIKKFGQSIEVSGSTHYAFPTSDVLSIADIADLRSLGLSNRKAEYVRDIAKASANGDIDLEGLRATEDASKVVEELTSLRGVGRWTAELVMIRGMARFEVAPADDLGIRRSISHFFFKGEPATAEMVRQLAKGWGAWGELAVFYVIMAEQYGVGADSGRSGA